MLIITENIARFNAAPTNTVAAGINVVWREHRPNQTEAVGEGWATPVKMLDLDSSYADLP
ncbi:MAG: hypothetical protein OXG44_19010 [Gammaproteobacteria bacterium]|nr:hypothetical protein [Gammaproteobacteria bacterium]